MGPPESAVGNLTAAFLDELLTCSLCHERMKEPSSLSCGHSFCRKCLRVALKHRRECPMCRAACYTVSEPRPNVALMALVREAFPDDTDEAECEEKQEDEEDGSEATRVLPLFLSSSVQLPLGSCSMHLFEPRYRLLTQRALDGGGDFAMVWARHGHGFPLRVDPAGLVGVSACMVHIERSRQTPDGRWNLACQGVAPARIEECWVEEGSGELYMARLRLHRPQGDQEHEEAEAPAAVHGADDPAASGAAAAVGSVARPSSAGDEPPGPGASRHERLQYIKAQMRHLGLTHHLTGQAEAVGDASADETYREEDVERFSWTASVALGGPPYGWSSDDDQQALLDARTVEDRLIKLCTLYHQAWKQRWSFNSWVTFGLRRWGPLLVAIFIAWVASGAKSLVS